MDKEITIIDDKQVQHCSTIFVLLLKTYEDSAVSKKIIGIKPKQYFKNFIDAIREVNVCCKKTWLTPEISLDLASFFVQAIKYSVFESTSLVKVLKDYISVYRISDDCVKFLIKNIEDGILNYREFVEKVVSQCLLGKKLSEQSKNRLMLLKNSKLLKHYNEFYHCDAPYSTKKRMLLFYEEAVSFEDIDDGDFMEKLFSSAFEAIKDEFNVESKFLENALKILELASQVNPAAVFRFIPDSETSFFKKIIELLCSGELNKTIYYIQETISTIIKHNWKDIKIRWFFDEETGFFKKINKLVNFRRRGVKESSKKYEESINWPEKVPAITAVFEILKRLLEDQKVVTEVLSKTENFKVFQEICRSLNHQQYQDFDFIKYKNLHENIENFKTTTNLKFPGKFTFEKSEIATSTPVKRSRRSDASL